MDVSTYPWTYKICLPDLFFQFTVPSLDLVHRRCSQSCKPPCFGNAAVASPMEGHAMSDSQVARLSVAKVFLAQVND